MIVRAAEKNADCRSGFIDKADADYPCATCNGSAMFRGPLDYPCLDNSLCCSECEAGRALAAQLAEIVTRTLEPNRTRK